MKAQVPYDLKISVTVWRALPGLPLFVLADSSEIRFWARFKHNEVVYRPNNPL
jgi:hypothetical protein